ncbi:MAG: hypothetical protein ABI759_11090 [Candidatus Solibacter sp.]
MQFQPQGKQAVGVCFDSDLGNTIDDALALAMLYGLQGKTETRVLSVSTTKSSLEAAIFGDILVRFYTGDPGGFGGATPIGLTLSGKMASSNSMMEAVVPDKKYTRTIAKMNDTADPVAVIRNALSAQQDQNAMVVLTGPATNLATMLKLPLCPPLITKKAQKLVIGVDAGTLSDIPALRAVLAEWPTPIVVAGAELGEEFPFPGASIDKDFAWSEAHPLVAAYKAYRPMPYDAPAMAMAAALYAVRPQENYFKVGAAGTFTVGDDGKLKHTPAANGKHTALMADASQKERIQQAYAEMASTKPVPRAQRVRPPQKKQ